MYVVCSAHPDREEVMVMGRTDPPYCFDFKKPIPKGEEFCGIPWAELRELDGFETEPETGVVISKTPRQPYTGPDVEVPDWIRKKPSP